MSRSTHSTPSSRPYDETVVPTAVCDQCSQAIEFGEEPLETEESGRMLAPERRRVVHFALRIGKSFEFVVECCHF